MVCQPLELPEKMRHSGTAMLPDSLPFRVGLGPRLDIAVVCYSPALAIIKKGASVSCTIDNIPP